MLLSDRICERDIGTLNGEVETWRELEDRLSRFCADVRAHPVDERDVPAAARTWVRRLAEADLLRLVAPAAWGGAFEQVSTTAICLARQWLARESGALDTAFVMQGLGSYPLVLAGSDALRRAILPRVVAGQTICAFALTEEHAGSDLGGVRTVAEPAPGGVRLSGEKRLISNAGVADSYVVLARETELGLDARGRAAFSAFWVPGDAAGLSVSPIQVIAPHPIGTVRFDGVAVPDEHRIGVGGQGLRIALSNLDQFRPTVGAAALGLADRALAESVRHLKERVQFGKPLAEQQGLRFALAESATEHLAAQLLVYRAAGACDRGETSPDASAVAKLHATETAQRIVDQAVQFLGGRGVTVGEVTERLYREVRALRIYEGTSEIQKLVIARSLLG